jgi:GDP-4-dehydro-6-deoxy-D-mannose reductase
MSVPLPAAAAPLGRALVTGAGGFVGGHLVRLLVEHRIPTWALVRGGGRTSEAAAQLTPCRGDLLDEGFAKELVRESAPTHVFHLAARMPYAPSSAEEMFAANVIGTANLLAALSGSGFDPWVMVASSSAVYGTAPRPGRITEATEFSPVSLYACSKIAQEMVALRFSLAERLRVLRVRTFNLVGPGQHRGLVTADLAWQVAECEARSANAVRVGNTTPRRDWVDVRDAVQAYWLLAQTGLAGRVVNVASGSSRSVRDCVEILSALARVPLQVEEGDGRSRGEEEIAEQVGDNARLRDSTGWSPSYTLEESLRDLLEDCRRRVGAGEEGG